MPEAMETKVRTDVMIDLETLDNKCTSAILAIGACEFDILTGEIIDTFEVGINRVSAMEFGTVSLGTCKFWLEQSDEAFNMVMNGDSLAKGALLALSNWFQGKEEAFVWGNGASFDLSILEYAYLQHGMSIPWKFYYERDVRTVRDLAEGLVDRNDFDFMGQPHVALDDATHQARYTAAMYKALQDVKRTALLPAEEPEDRN